jgi:uncharacterized protein
MRQRMKSGPSGVRVVVDTNIWVSAALSPNGYCAPVLASLRASIFTAVVCPQMQRELSVVLNRPHFATKYGLSGLTIAGITTLLHSRAESIPDPPIVPVSRDPRDDIFIAVARAARANVLVTRDDDLKRDPNVMFALRDSGTQTTSVREFRELLARSQQERP